MSLIVLWTLTERIDKSIVGKLIKAKANFGLGHRIKTKKSINLLMNLQMNFTNQKVENLSEKWLM